MTHASLVAEPEPEPWQEQVQAQAEPESGSAGLQLEDRVEDPVSNEQFCSLQSARRLAIDRFEVEYIRALLRRAEGNVTRAAEFAQVSRQVIHKLIAKHRL